MPFEPMSFFNQHAKEVMASVGYRKHQAPKGKAPGDRRPKLVIGIPAATAKQAKLNDKDHYVLMYGRGADLGKARICNVGTSKEGVKARLLKGGAGAFRFGYSEDLGPDAAEKEFVKVGVVNGDKPLNSPQIEIALPAWFILDEKDRPKKKAA